MTENNNISFNEFSMLLTEALREVLQDDVSVAVRAVRKNNEVTHDALFIHKGESDVSPAIYLNEFYNDYLRSGSMQKTIDDILRLYHESISDVEKIDLKGELFDNVRDRIIIKLVNYDMNRELLKDLPHIRIHDLAVIFLVQVKIRDESRGVVKITHAYMEKLGIDLNEFLPKAIENTERLYPPVVLSMREYLEEAERKYSFFSFFRDEDAPEVRKAMDRLIIISNEAYTDGASAIFCRGVLESCRKRLGDRMVLIPSSINEWLVFSAEECEPTAEEMALTVRSVNDGDLSHDEILSYSVYHYPEDSFELEGLKLSRE